jgi:hypothetical protein
MTKTTSEYRPKTGERCLHGKTIELCNCPICEGTGWKIDFRLIREKAESEAAIKAGLACAWPRCLNAASLAEIRKLLADLTLWVERGEKLHALAVIKSIKLELENL